VNDDPGMDLLTPAEVAGMVRLPVGTLSYFRSAGGGPAYFKLGRRVMYRRSAVESWVAEQEAKEQR
jgi:predicted DNA-binding transcriptional regulator AlpA